MLTGKNTFILSFLSVLALMYISLVCLRAQEVIEPEKEYSEIRALAFEGKLIEAEQKARNLVALYPAYGDAQVLLARILAWQKKYEPAIIILDTLISKEPQNLDAIEARNDIVKWMDGVKILDQQRDLRNLSKEIVLDTIGNDLRAGFHFDTFQEPYSRFWQVYTIGAGKYSPGKKFIGGLNLGHIYMESDPKVRKTEIQLETEAYLRINMRNYCWISYALSPGDYFPHHRLSGEIWHNFSGGWVASTGFNYYYFDRNIFIVSGSVEKYLGSFWFSGKLNLYLKEHGITTSFYLNTRKYFNNVNYLQVTLGTGTAPDEPYDIETDLSRLKANIIRLTYFTTLSSKILLRSGIGYSYEEYFEAKYRNRFDGSIGFIYLLPVKNEN